MQNENIFFEWQKNRTFNTEFETYPFEKIQIEHYIPAAKAALEETRRNISEIKKQPANFQNTILKLETASEFFEIVSTVYFNLFSAEATNEHQKLAQEMSSISATLSSEISLDEELFLKIKEVFESRASLGLNQEQLRLTEKFYRQFTRNGALLPSEKKNQLKEIDQKLSALAPAFSENVLKETNVYEKFLDSANELDGMPDWYIENAKEESVKKGKPDKWFVGLSMPSYLPLQQFCKNENLRKELWFQQSTKATQGNNSNIDNVLQIVRLRNQRAVLLGFKNHAEYILGERMAETPDKVYSFINNLLEPSLKKAKQELEEIKLFRKKSEGSLEINPWDFTFYSEKLKIEKYSFNSEELRPYFSLEKVVAGAFEHAAKLYDLNFIPNSKISVYHPDVKAYEVYDNSNNEFIGIFYTDFFPRETKKNGAWMTSYFEQGYFSNKVRRPHISIVCNFTKPTATKPSLLSYEEVQTLFHEFGHALHGLLSKCEFRSIAGTNVYWDFVELPSQIMENWVGEKESLDLFAEHFETKEKISPELVNKIKDSSQFLSGYSSLRQLQFCILDMAWHTTDPSNVTSVLDFEIEATKKTQILPRYPGTSISCGFSHIFAGGYSAGYYSYKWAEVLDADAFEAFKEKGLFNKEIANNFKNNILSKGGSEHPMELYKKFRGREPDVKALMKREGLQ